MLGRPRCLLVQFIVQPTIAVPIQIFSSRLVSSVPSVASLVSNASCVPTSSGQESAAARRYRKVRENMSPWLSTLSDEPPDDPWPVLDYGEPVTSSSSKFNLGYQAQSKPVQIHEEPNADTASSTIQELGAEKPHTPNTKSNRWFSNRKVELGHIP